MANIYETPKGQISSLILTTLLERDKYGYEIIDEVLANSKGLINIKQPSLYSSLKRMEEQSLITSYWRDSDIGGKRHYYHITDLGKKHIEKWQTSTSLKKEDVNKSQDDVKVLQQENIFSMIHSDQKTNTPDIIEQNNQQDKSYIQFDLFNQSTIITPAIDKPFIDEEINKETKQDNSLTEKTLNTSLATTQPFNFIKKSNLSFAENSSTVSENNNMYLKLEEETKSETEFPTTEVNNLNVYKTEISEVKDIRNNIQDNQNNNNPSTLSNDLTETTNFDNNTQIVDNINNLNSQPEEDQKQKDDGVFITDRLNIDDIPKMKRLDVRKFETYVSGNNLSSKKDNYKDRVSELYEKSISNSENKELELIDDKINFYSYDNLKAFYKDQNIKFKPYIKALKKTDKSMDIINVNKLHFVDSLILFILSCLVNTFFGLFLQNKNYVLLNTPILYVLSSTLFFTICLIFFIIYAKAPHTKINFDRNKIKIRPKNILVFILLSLIIFAINLIIGFNFITPSKYLITLIYPILILSFYFVSVINKKILIKTKYFY